MSKYAVSIEQALGSACALLCEVLENKQREASRYISACLSALVMNHTRFDVPGLELLVVHVLLLIHEFMYKNICLPHSWLLSVTVHVFHVPKTHR